MNFLANHLSQYISLHLISRTMSRLAVALLVASVAVPSLAVEPSRQFVEGLRERGMHEMALDYLADLEKNPLAAKDFVRAAAYEEAATYIDWAGAARDAKQQESLLEKGEAKLNEFKAANQNHPLASSAEMQIGNIALHRARMKRSQAESKDRQEEEQAALRDEAIKLFAAANKSYADAELKFKAARDKIPQTSKKPDDREMRNTLRNGMLHSGVSAANSLYEMAKLQKDGSEEQKKTFIAAAKVYEELYFKYQRYLLGLRYHLQQARCLQETHDKDEIETALLIYSEFEGLPDDSTSNRELKLLAAAYQVAALTTPELKQFDDAFKFGELQMKKANSTDKKTEEYMTLVMEMALAKEAASKETKDPIKKRKFVSEAIELARDVQRAGGTQGARAQQLLKRLQGDSDTPQAEPTTFLAAYARGNASFDDWQRAKQSLAEAEKTMNKTAAAEFQKVATESQANAVKYYDLALSLADKRKALEEIADIHYRTCYLYWHQEKIFRAAALAEFIVEMYSETASAKKAAHLAMTAYGNLAASITDGNKTFELARLTSLANRIVEEWPNSAESEAALLTLFNFALVESRSDALELADRSKKLAEAAALLEQLGDETAVAKKAAIQLGLEYWRHYQLSLRARANETDETKEKVTEEQLEAFSSKAKELLSQGLTSTEEGEATPQVAHAALRLAKILVDDSEANKAVALLEDKHHGPLTLVAAKHEAVQAAGFAIDTYNTALRAYVGSTPQNIDQAKAMLENLKSTIGRDVKAREQLDAELIRISNSLRKQLDTERLKGHAEKVKDLANGIQVFLAEIGKSNDEYSTLSSVASTFYSLGESFYDAGSHKEADRFFQEADNVYRRIFTTIEDDPSWGPENMPALRVRYARNMLKLKEYDPATTILIRILTDKPTSLSVQVEAAKAYQSWAEEFGASDTKSKDKMLNRALAGHLRHPEDNNKKIIWGWGQLRKLTARDIKRFGPYYHEACYNMALCLFEQAKLRKGDDRKKRAEMAEQVIETAFSSDPTMGGSDLYSKYNALLKSVQTELKKTPAVGLKKS